MSKTLKSIYSHGLDNLIQSYPKILEMEGERLDDRIRFLEGLGVGEGTSLNAVLRSFPVVLSYEGEGCSEVVDFLEGVGVKNVGRFVTRLPPVLGMGRGQMERKWRRAEEGGMTCYELVRFPAFFSYPEERMRVRFEYLRRRRRRDFKLDEILRGGDDDFARMVGDNDGKMFRQFSLAYKLSWRMKEKMRKGGGKEKENNKNE